MHSAYIQHDGPSAQGNACFGDVVANVPERSPAARDAVAFLQSLDLHGWHNVVAIGPNQPPTGRTFPPNSWHEIAEWVDRNNAKANCYFSLNEPRPDAPNKKLEKADIARIRGVGVDLDPIKHEDRPLTSSEFAEARAELRSRQLPDAAQFPPSLTIDTGNGLQHIWLTAESINAGAEGQWAERCGKTLAKALRGDAVQNIDRVLRLPGTVNLLTPTKLAKYPPGNRTATTEIQAAPRRYTRDEIGSLAPSAPHDERDDIDDPHSSDGAAAIAQALREIGPAPVFTGSFTDLDPSVAERLAIARQRNPVLDSLLEGDPKALRGSRAGDTTGSQFLFSLARYLGDAQFSASEFADVACAWPVVFSTLEKAEDAGGTGRALARAWGKTGAPRAAEISATVAKFFDANPPVVERQAPAAGDYFQLLSMQGILDMPAPKFVIDGYIPENGLGFLYGRPGTKKSFIALDWSLHLAFGKPDWHGYAIDPKSKGAVVYLAGEGASGMQARCRAWMQHHSIAQDDRAASQFYLIPQSVNFMSDNDREKLRNTILAKVAGPVSAVFIDTVSRSVAGADENSQKDMSKFVDACTAVQRLFGCFVVGVHHASKQGDMRGSTVLLGAGDFVFSVEQGKASSASGITPVRLKCEKQKDAPDGWYDEFAFAHIQVDAETSSLVPVRIMTRERPRIEASADMKTEILQAMQAAIDAKEPWAKAPKSRYAERGAVRRLVVDFHMDADAAGDLLADLERDGFIQHGTTDSHSKAQGYKVIRFPDAEAAEIEARDEDGAFD